MRRLLVCLCVCSVIMLGQAVSAAIAWVQQNTAAEVNGDGVVPVTFASSVTSGNLIVVYARHSNAGDSFTSVTDGQGNTYTTHVTELYDTSDTTTLYGLSAIATSTGSLTVTCNFSVDATSRTGCGIAEFSGTFSACRLDQSTSTSQLTGTAVSSGNVTTTVADALLFGGMGYAGAGGPVTAGTGYSNLIEDTTGRFALESKIVSGTVTDDADFTIDTSEPWGAMVLAFSEAACASGGAKSLLLMGVG